MPNRKKINEDLWVRLEAAIERKDRSSLYRMMPEFVALPVNEWVAIRQQIKHSDGRYVALTDLDVLYKGELARRVVDLGPSVVKLARISPGLKIAGLVEALEKAGMEAKVVRPEWRNKWVAKKSFDIFVRESDLEAATKVLGKFEAACKAAGKL